MQKTKTEIPNSIVEKEEKELQWSFQVITLYSILINSEIDNDTLLKSLILGRVNVSR